MRLRLRRYQTSGHLRFLTFSCQDRLPYLKSSESKALFESILESRRLRYGFKIHGYVVMPKHVHLLVSEPFNKPLSKAIASLDGLRVCGNKRPPNEAAGSKPSRTALADSVRTLRGASLRPSSCFNFDGVA